MTKVFVAGVIGLSAIAAAFIYLVMAPDPTTGQVALSESASALDDANLDSDISVAELMERSGSTSTTAAVDEQYGSETDLEQAVPTARATSFAGANTLDPIVEIRRRSQDVNDQFASLGPKRLSELIDQYISQADNDGSWELSAEQQIREWYVKNAPDPESLINSECVKDVCYIDIEMAALEHMIFYKKAGRQWANEPASGFLPANFSARAGEEFHRIYFFRDSFEISEP